MARKPKIDSDYRSQAMETCAAMVIGILKALGVKDTPKPECESTPIGADQRRNRKRTRKDQP